MFKSFLQMGGLKAPRSYGELALPRCHESGRWKAAWLPVWGLQEKPRPLFSRSDTATRSL